MDRDTLDVFKTAVSKNIKEHGNLLRDPSVRGNLDPKVLKPEVDKGLSFKNLPLRLRRRIKAACILTDVVHLGPGANVIEAEAWSRLNQLIDRLGDSISPTSSCSGSATATDSD